MTIQKNWYESKTIVAAIGLIVLLVNKHFNIVVISEAEIIDLLYKGTELFLALAIIYGRVTAKKEIK